MDLSDFQLSPAPILTDRRLLWLAPKHCAGSPVLTPLSCAHIPQPLPRSSRKMLATLSSLPDFGLRFAPTISTGTLGFSRLARRSVFIVVCTLADSAWPTFFIKGFNRQITLPRCLDCCRWNVSCRVGYLPPTGSRCPFHGTPEPRPPMVCVKRPQSVLVVFHFL